MTTVATMEVVLDTLSTPSPEKVGVQEVVGVAWTCRTETHPDSQWLSTKCFRFRSVWRSRAL